jgi:Farnesoic acid 0-methyl transferase
MLGAWRPWTCGLALAGMFAMFAISATFGCRARGSPGDAPFADNFDRTDLGAAWNATAPAAYRIDNGQLEVSNGYNHPAWLRRRLPSDVLLELDVMSKSPAGDIKVELYGDGESFDPDKGGYTSTGYVLIFGGWHNSLSVICRQDEHGDGRKAERSDVRVEPLRRYHFTIARRGGTIDWAIDGQPFLAWTDPAPFGGPGHEFFAVNDWEADVTFDNLSIRSAP